MIKMRLQGTPEDLQATIAMLPQLFRVLEVSQPYPNRGTSAYYRCYADVEVLPPVAVKVETGHPPSTPALSGTPGTRQVTDSRPSRRRKG